MKQLYSIEPIQKVFQTQMEPVLVRCNDWQYYVCKHSKHTPCDTLFNEFLAARFLAIWGVEVLDPFIVQIKSEHLPDKYYSGKLQPASLQQSLIGFMYLKNQKYVTQFESGFKENLADRKKIVNLNQLVRIALFDLWVGNDDRNWNNYNLLIESKADGFHFIPIDHETIFSGNSLNHGVTIQTENDTLILTDLFKAVITKSYVKELLFDFKTIEKDFYLCVANCKSELDKLLEEVPHDWKISIATKRTAILENIFTPMWLDKVFRYFLIYLKQLR
ncbi:MAG: hypothetical protein JXR22_03985 [Prolixibacteraceae bacterium]|nr:hypothetical protein [Prolixibacteraceae bacterium]